MAVTIEKAKRMGYEDAMQAISESGCCDSPDGGWDSWLVNGIGFDETCKLFQTNPEDSDPEWSEEMERLLTAYNEGGEQAQEDCAE